MSGQAKLLYAHPSKLGEGAIWDAREQLLYWVDILSHEVHIFDPKTKTDRAIDVGSDVGTVVKRASGGLMLSVQRGFAFLDLRTRETTLVADVHRDDAAIRFNDGKCDPAGRFWAGTMAYAFAKGAGKLYRLDLDKSVHAMVHDVTCSNGIVWTRDNKTMYYIDTPTGQVSAFDYDDATGNLANRRVAVQIPQGMGHPDGMTIDGEDNIWVCLWGGGRVAQFDPRSGKHSASIEVPGVKNVTSCALGGPNFTDMFITTAAPDDGDASKQPNAGSLFHATVKVPGVPAFEYKG